MKSKSKNLVTLNGLLSQGYKIIRASSTCVLERDGSIIETDFAVDEYGDQLIIRTTANAPLPF